MEKSRHERLRIFRQIGIRVMLHDLKQGTKTINSNTSSRTVLYTWDSTIVNDIDIKPLTIPVNSIDTIPESPKPSASMYL